MFLPGKKKLLLSRANWIQLDQQKLHSLLANKFKLSLFDISDIGIVQSRVDEELSDTKTPNPLIMYEVCMDLEIYPSEFTMSNITHRRSAHYFHKVLTTFIQHFEALARRINPDLVVYYQGYPIDAAVARSYCIRHNIHLLALENTFHKEKFIWDSISGITVNKSLAANFIWRHFNDVSQVDARQDTQEYLQAINSLKSDEHSTMQYRVSAQNQKKLVVFLGQVYTDASVLFGINDFKNPIDVIETLVHHCITHNHHLVLKLHPKEERGQNFQKRAYDSLTLRKLKENVNLYSSIIQNGFIIDYCEIDTFHLIQQADVCVTVNSQAGFEALLLGSEVIACGKGFYTDLGVTFNAWNASELAGHLSDIVSGGLKRNNKDLVEKVFHILLRKYFRPKAEANLAELIEEKI